MTQPLDPDACRRGRPSGVDGFCEDHAEAVAFRVPVAVDGEVPPAVDWHWAHDQPCPLGDSWLIRNPAQLDYPPARVWACPHREHRPGR
jgi:hypothetical protein